MWRLARLDVGARGGDSLTLALDDELALRGDEASDGGVVFLVLGLLFLLEKHAVREGPLALKCMRLSECLN